MTGEGIHCRIEALSGEKSLLGFRFLFPLLILVGLVGLIEKSVSSDNDRRSGMEKQSKNRGVVLLRKDGVVQNFLPLDGSLLKLLEKRSGSGKSSSRSAKFVSGFRRLLGFGG